MSLKRKSVFKVVEVVVPSEEGPRMTEVTFEVTTPLETYKKDLEKLFEIDLYGRRLIFRYKGQKLFYAKDA